MDEELRQYTVTVVGRSVDDRDLAAPGPLTTPGVEIEVDGDRVVLRMAILAPDARDALDTARGTADDFFRVVATSYAPFRIDPRDERDVRV